MGGVAVSTSRDHKRVVFGTWDGASVWDADLRDKVIHVEVGNDVRALDVSPDSTRFVTGTARSGASVWSISSGERLVDPLEHDSYVTGIRFSPNGKYIATACSGGSVRVFESRTGDRLITIDVVTPWQHPATPLAWSDDGQQILVSHLMTTQSSLLIFPPGPSWPNRRSSMTATATPGPSL